MSEPRSSHEATPDPADPELVAYAEVAERVAALDREAREAHAQLDAVLANVPAIIWRWEPAGRCTFVSDAWTALLGRDPGEALGTGWAESVHPDDRAAFEERCVRAMQEGVPFSAEYRLRKADGTFITVNDQGRPMDDAATPGGFVGAALDVTVQREAEAKTRATNALLSGAAEGMGVGLAVKDRSGRYVVVNEVMATSLGTSAAGMIGRNDQDLGVPGWESLAGEDRLVMRTGQVQRIERDVGEGGSRRTFLIAKSPLRATDGRTDGVIVVDADVTVERLRRDRAERLERLARTLAGSRTGEEVADAVLGSVLDTLEAPYGAIGLPTGDGRTLTLQRQRGFDEKMDRWRALPLDSNTPPALAFREGRPCVYGTREELLEAFPELEGQIRPFEARAAVPLLGREGPIGVLYTAFDEPMRFDEDTVAFYEQAAELIARALERAALSDAAARSAEETGVLLEVAADLSRAVTMGEVRRVAVERAKQAVHADACLIGLVDHGAGTIVYPDSGGYPSELVAHLPTSLEPRSSPAADAIVGGRAAAFATSAELLDAYPDLGPMLEHLPFAARLFVPVTGSGEPIGMMVASAQEPGRFGPAELRLLEAVARQCGQSLERAAFYRDARASARRAAKLQAATQQLASATTTTEAQDRIMDAAMTLVNARVGGLGMLDATGSTLSAARWVDVPAEAVARWMQLPLDRVSVGRDAVDARAPVVRTLDELRATDPGLANHVAALSLGSVAVVPLVGGDDAVLGLLGLGFHPGRELEPADVELLRSFADRSAAALARGQLLEAEARTRRELEGALSRLSRLQSVSAAISTAFGVDEVAAKVLEQTTEALSGSGGAVFVADGQHLRMVATTGIAIDSPYDHEDSDIRADARVALADAFRTGHVVYSPTVEEWRRRYPEGQAMFEGRARSTIAVPFVLEGRVLGSMSILFEREQTLGRPERRLARTIGEQAGQALERARLYEAEVARTARMRRLQEVTAELAASAVPEEVSRVLAAAGVKAAGAQAGIVVMAHEEHGEVRIAATTGFPDALVDPFLSTPIDARLPGNDAIRSRLPSFLRSPEEIARRYPDLNPEGPNLREGAWATIPLLVRGRAIGAVHFSYAEPQPFDAEQIGGLAAIVTEAALAMNRAQQYAREREVSEVLQENLLAKDVISAWRGTDVVTWYSAGAENLEVGGDWFDVIELPNGRLGVSVGDVVGRGLRAAAAMGQLRSAMRGIALDGRGPSLTLEGLDRFARSTPGTELATVIYGELDPSSGAFHYASAGHPPPVAFVDGRIEVLEDGRSPLLAAGYTGPRAAGVRVLSPGSTVILYTDGLVERRGEPFDRGIERLMRSVEGAAEEDLDVLSETIARDLVGEAVQGDDVAFLCLRVGQPGTVFTASLESDPARLAELRQALRGWLASLALETVDAEGVVLAVNEAAANAIEHGYRDGGGIVEVHARWSGGRLMVEIRDQGRWRTGPHDRSRGRGISMMRMLMDSVEVDHRNGGTAVRLRRRFEVAEPTTSR
jgi:serine/threonine-protein kinase RsbW